MVCRGIAAEVSMLWLTSNNSLPSRRLSVPSDHRIIRLFDSRRCENHVKRYFYSWCLETYILTRGVFGPTPANGVLNFELDGHTFLTDAFRLSSVFFLIFWPNVCIRVKWFRV